MKKLQIFYHVLIISALLSVFPAFGQQKRSTIKNDSNTPLHLLQPDYKTPYRIPEKNVVKTDLDRILTYLEGVTPAVLENKSTGKEVSNNVDFNFETQIKRGDFRLGSYEWGVTYAAMLATAEITGDKRYENYVNQRFSFLAENYPYFRKLYTNYGSNTDSQIRQIVNPQVLDDAGAVCVAMIKATRRNPDLKLKPLIDNYMNFIMYHEYRLYDGTFARRRPQLNTVWLDDMFMSIPALVQMGKLTGKNKYFDEAARQISSFSEKMFVSEKGLFRHGWVESMKEHPSFFWARANGWALLALTEALDALPESHPQKDKVLELFKLHIGGLLSLQSGEGFWH